MICSLTYITSPTSKGRSQLGLIITQERPLRFSDTSSVQKKKRMNEYIITTGKWPRNITHQKANRAVQQVAYQQLAHALRGTNNLHRLQFRDDCVQTRWCRRLRTEQSVQSKHQREAIAWKQHSVEEVSSLENMCLLQ